MEHRDIVKRHADFMEMKLLENDDLKGDSWKRCDEDWLLMRLDQEVKEFKDALIKGNLTEARREGADVSNIIMFLNENRLTKWAEASAEKMFGKD